jgi:MFS family permease
MSATTPDGDSTAAALSGPWAPLRSAEFRRFWLGGAASMSFYWLIEASLAWQMRLMSDADPFLVSLVPALMQFTVMAAVMPAGVVADIVDRRRLIFVSHAWIALAAGLLAALAINGRLTPTLLLLVAPAIALTQAIRMPVIGSLVIDTVERPALGAAVALNAMGLNISRIIGPALAGVLLSFGGVFAALALASFGLFIAGAMLATVGPGPKRQETRLTLRQFFDDVSEERRQLVEFGWKRNLLLRLAAFLACSAAVPALLPLLVGTGTQYGLMLSLYGVGALASLLMIGRPRTPRGSEQRAIAAQCMHALAMIGLGLAGGPLLVAAALVICGGTWFAMSNGIMTAAQLQLPEASRARGLSIVYAAGMAAMAAGGATWGWLARHYGVDSALWVAGVVSLLLTVLTRKRAFIRDATATVEP